MSEIARPSAFVLRFFSEPKEEFGVPAPWSFEGSPACHRPSDLVWSGNDNIVRGRGDPHPLWRSSLVEPGAKVTVIVFTEEIWWPSSNTLSECYNNVDVGVPLWLTEPRDKHPRQEFAISYPSL